MHYVQSILLVCLQLIEEVCHARPGHCIEIQGRFFLRSSLNNKQQMHLPVWGSIANSRVLDPRLTMDVSTYDSPVRKVRLPGPRNHTTSNLPDHATIRLPLNSILISPSPLVICPFRCQHEKLDALCP
ncbi:hypothetical protein BDV18DRAFT_131397 [Aspergillus unguis]